MKKYLWGALILVVLLATASLAANAQATTRDLSGWAWSSNIGWVSFNSADSGTGTNGVGTSPVSYKVQLESDGDLTGYAWSSNVGWIKFDPSLTGAPSGATKASVNTSNNQVSGYVRACTGTVNRDCASATRTDGWDGWISLSGTNHSSGDASGNGGVTYVVSGNTATLKGYSWGSDVVGWLKFSPTTGVNTTVTPGSDSLTLTVGGITADSGSTPSSVVTRDAGVNGTTSSVPVSWTATAGYTSCQKGSTGSAIIASGWTDHENVSNSGSGSIVFDNDTNETKTKSIILTCLEGTDTVTRTVNVSIAPYSAPTLSCIKPNNSDPCVGAQFIYDSGSLPPGTPATKLWSSCPTDTGPYYCAYKCDAGYEINGNRCTMSDLEEI